MKTNRQLDNLAQKIALLKNKQKYDFEILKTHFRYTYQDIKPVNIIKNTLHEVVSSKDIKIDLLKGVVGYFSNKFFSKINKNPIIKTIEHFLNKFANK